MYLQIEFPSVDDQMTRFYCKGNPCCWPVDKNDSAVCFIFEAQFLNVAWPALYLFDRPLSSQLLCPLQKRLSYYSSGSCQRAALPLGMYKSYYQRTDFTRSVAIAIPSNSLWLLMPAMSPWEILLGKEMGVISFCTPWMMVLGFPGQFSSCL